MVGEQLEQGTTPHDPGRRIDRRNERTLYTTDGVHRALIFATEGDEPKCKRCLAPIAQTHDCIRVYPFYRGHDELSYDSLGHVFVMCLDCADESTFRPATIEELALEQIFGEWDEEKDDEDEEDDAARDAWVDSEHPELREQDEEVTG